VSSLRLFRRQDLPNTLSKTQLGLPAPALKNDLVTILEVGKLLSVVEGKGLRAVKRGFEKAS
jgi:hypothetical protein